MTFYLLRLHDDAPFRPGEDGAIRKQMWLYPPATPGPVFLVDETRFYNQHSQRRSAGYELCCEAQAGATSAENDEIYRIPIAHAVPGSPAKGA